VDLAVHRILIFFSSENRLDISSVNKRYASGQTDKLSAILAMLWGAVGKEYQEIDETKLSPRGRRDDMPPADGSSTHGGSTSVRGRVRSPHISWPAVAKLQATIVA